MVIFDPFDHINTNQNSTVKFGSTHMFQVWKFRFNFHYVGEAMVVLRYVPVGIN